MFTVALQDKQTARFATNNTEVNKDANNQMITVYKMCQALVQNVTYQ